MTNVLKNLIFKKLKQNNKGENLSLDVELFRAKNTRRNILTFTHHKT